MNSEETEAPRSKIYHPPRALSLRAVEPILFLADQMALADNAAVPRETRVVDQLADAAGLSTFRHQPWYREMTESGALKRLNTDLSKRATLVVLALVLKADMKRKPSEHAFFTRIREALGANSVTVPVDLDAHKALAMEYFVDGGIREVTTL